MSSWRTDGEGEVSTADIYVEAIPEPRHCDCGGLIDTDDPDVTSCPVCLDAAGMRRGW